MTDATTTAVAKGRAAEPGKPAGSGLAAVVSSDITSQLQVPRAKRATATAGDRALLRTLIRAFVHDRSADDLAVEIEQTVSEVSSWECLEGLLQIHRCTALAYRLLSQPAVRQSSGIPQATLDRFRARYVASFTQTASEPALLQAVLTAFSNARIPTLVVKGPAIGTWLYDDSALREHDDIDLLVRAIHAADADAVMTTLGFRSGYRPPLYFGETPGTADYRRGFDEVHVDLSFDPLRLFWSPDLDDDPFYGWQARSQMLTIGGLHVPTLGPEDQFVHLARHLQFHDYFRANWFIDVMLLLRRFGTSLDWHLVGRLATEHGLQGGLYRTLELAASLYDAPVPAEAWPALCPNRVVRHLHRRIWPDSVADLRERARMGGAPISPRFLSPRGTHPFAGLILLCMGRDRMRHLRYLARRVVPPGSWLRARYGFAGDDPSGGGLLLRYWRDLYAIRRQVRGRSR